MSIATVTPARGLSVVVPARNCPETLARSLAALAASDLPRDAWELIVVDDGSTDATAAVAARVADRVVRLAGPARGPGFARNRGVEAASGVIVVFIDADVCVHRDTLRRFGEVLGAEPGLGAAFGAYDTQPPAPGVVSQYRNLLHHYEHVRAAGPATTFWAGCGAVRRAAFIAVGMFDEARYPRPQIEDIEFGYRLSGAGYGIALRPEIQCTHLKQWDFRRMVTTDVRDRGIPWMQLLLERRGLDADGPLNLRVTEKLYTAAVGAAGLCLLLSIVLPSAAWLVAALALALAVIAGNWPLVRWFARHRGLPFAICVVPLRFVYYALNGVSAVGGAWAHYWRPRPRTL